MERLKQIFLQDTSRQSDLQELPARSIVMSRKREDQPAPQKDSAKSKMNLLVRTTMESLKPQT